jgi:ribulose-5-phosphate 4-epimerase/fuculose-1-phosphate aldolase
VAQAARVLSALGLVTAFGHVSARTGRTMLVTPAADLGTVTAVDVREVDLDATALPAGVPAEAGAHLALSRGRPDAGAVARAQPTGAIAVAAATTTMEPLHGQAAWLGAQGVPVHDDARLLRSPALATVAIATLGRADALLLRGNGALTLGATPGLAVARMAVLDTACTAYLAADGPALVLGVEEVLSWRTAADELLPRLWDHLLGRYG